MPNAQAPAFVIPRSFAFTGTSTDRINCGSYAGLDEVSGTTLVKMPAFTLVARVRATGTVGTGKRLISRQTSALVGWRWNTFSTTGRLEFAWNASTTTMQYVTSGNAVTPQGANRWMWLVCAFDSNGPAGQKVTMWSGLEGMMPTRLALSTTVDAAGAYQSNTGASVFLGNDSGTTPANPFPGAMAFGGIFRRAWTETDIARFLRDPMAYASRALGFWLPGARDGVVLDLSGRHPVGVPSGSVYGPPSISHRRRSLTH